MSHTETLQSRRNGEQLAGQMNAEGVPLSLAWPLHKVAVHLDGGALLYEDG